MVDVNEELTRKVAHLAHLELSGAEVTLFTKQLGEILSFVKKIEELEINDPSILPLYHPHDLEPLMREEVQQVAEKSTQGSSVVSKVLECAPDVFDDCYKVPPIL